MRVVPSNRLDKQKASLPWLFAFQLILLRCGDENSARAVRKSRSVLMNTHRCSGGIHR